MVIVLEKGVKFVWMEPKTLEIIPIFWENVNVSEVTVCAKKLILGSQMAKVITIAKVMIDNTIYLGFEKTWLNENKKVCNMDEFYHFSKRASITWVKVANGWAPTIIVPENLSDELDLPIKNDGVPSAP